MKEQYLKTIVTVRFPWFASNGTTAHLQDMGLGGRMTDVTPKPSKSMASVRVLRFEFDHYRADMANSFVKQMQTMFNANYLTIAIGTEEVFKTEWDLYEYLLSVMDWTFEFSDDHRSWSAGNAMQQRLKTLRFTLGNEDKQRAEDLWNKYAK